MIKYLIFDMDGTILDSERFSYRCFQEVFASYGVECREEYYRRVVGTTRPLTIQIFEEIYGDQLDIDKVLREISALELKKYEAGETIPIKKGYFELREYMKKHGIKAALATSTRREKTERKLIHNGVGLDFTHIICGDEVTHGKPHPEMYETILKRISVSPEEVFVLEDSPNGVRSAHGAGLPVIMIPDMAVPGKDIEAMLYAKAEDLGQVIPFL